MFEYFMFCLASAATMIPDIDPRVKDRKESYSQLVVLYLEFFLPTFVHEGKEMFSTPTKHSNLRSREPVKSILPLFTNVFNSNLNNPIMISNFVIQIFVEYWFQFSADAKVSSLIQFVKPNNIQLQCSQMLVSRLVSLNLCHISPEVQLTRVRSDPTGSAELYDISKSNAYRALLPRFYSFMSSCFENWPRDDSISQVVELWVSFITPWKLFSSEFTIEWAPFVLDNFLFYTRIFEMFLDRTRFFDYYASARFKRLTPNSASPAKYLAFTVLVTRVFSNNSLVKFLHVLESALSNLDTFSVSHVSKSPANSPTQHKSPLNDPFYQYHNSGPKLLSMMNSLQGNTNYNQIFHQPDKQIFDAILRLAYTMQDSKERLDNILSETSQVRKPSETIFSLFFSMFQAEPELKNLTREEIAEIKRRLNQFNEIFTTLKQTWSLDMEFSRPSDMRRDISNTSLNEEKLVAVAPNVYAPEVSSNNANKLTARGREQVNDLILDSKGSA